MKAVLCKEPGPPEHLVLEEIALRNTAWKGRSLVVGFSNGTIPRIPLNLALLKGCSIVGVFFGAFAQRDPRRNMQNFQQLLAWLTPPRPSAASLTARSQARS